MTDKDPFEFPPAGRVRFLDVPELDHIVTGKEVPLTGWHKFQEALALHPLPKVIHITHGLPLRDPRGVMQLLIGEEYERLVEQRSRLLTVNYFGGYWEGQTLSGVLIQRWGAPPTRKQICAARRLMYAQRRLARQLAASVVHNNPAAFSESQLSTLTK